MKEVQELLLCECASSEHQMIMRYFEDDLDEDDLNQFGDEDHFEDYGFEENWN